MKSLLQGTGPCALTGKEINGISASFEDRGVTNAQVSGKGFKRLLAVKARQQEEMKPVEMAPIHGPVTN